MLYKKLLPAALFTLAISAVSAVYSIEEAPSKPVSNIESEQGQETHEKITAKLMDVYKNMETHIAELKKINETLGNPEVCEGFSEEDINKLEESKKQLTIKLEEYSEAIEQM
jgi:valyl-tRNA synthetase